MRSQALQVVASHGSGARLARTMRILNRSLWSRLVGREALPSGRALQSPLPERCGSENSRSLAALGMTRAERNSEAGVQKPEVRRAPRADHTNCKPLPERCGSENSRSLAALGMTRAERNSEAGVQKPEVRCAPHFQLGPARYPNKPRCLINAATTGGTICSHPGSPFSTRLRTSPGETCSCDSANSRIGTIRRFSVRCA